MCFGTDLSVSDSSLRKQFFVIINYSRIFFMQFDFFVIKGSTMTHPGKRTVIKLWGEKWIQKEKVHERENPWYGINFTAAFFIIPSSSLLKLSFLSTLTLSSYLQVLILIFIFPIFRFIQLCLLVIRRHLLQFTFIWMFTNNLNKLMESSSTVLMTSSMLSSEIQGVLSSA